MPTKNTGRIAKVRSNKNATRHQKNHRWESFTNKISQFNSLQPLRRVRRHDLDNEDDSVSTSYFQNGLQKWTELNVSKGFTSFRREVWPLCETLAQILHFESRIMDLLEKYIAEQDKESLEPLLDLLTAFAHDLGVRFEKHYAKSLNLIIAIASRSQPVEVIEWTFGALAFLFKYLSKLIVPDLRPTYDVLSNLLGRARHPPHIARFAAEAMSFLVRKAAAPSYRESALKSLVEHIRDDITSMIGERQYTLYRDGIMTMFAEAVKGNERTIQSVGPAIYTSLIDAIPEVEKALGTTLIWTNMICGVLTSTIHHAQLETFGEYSEALHNKIDEKTEQLKQESPSWKMVPYIKVLSTLAGVRKGSRVEDWPRVARQCVELLTTAVPCTKDLGFDESNDLWQSVVANVALICHHAPIDALIPHLNTLLQTLTKEPFTRWFVPFSAFFCELDSRRFGSLFRGEFQKYVATQWSQGNNEEMLCILLPKMMDNKAFPPCGEKDCLKLPQSWQDQIVSKFENLEISPFPERGPYNKDPQVWRDRCLPKYAALFKVLELTSLHPSTNARIAELLLRKLKLALRPSSTLASDEVNFILSQGFHAYLGMSAATAQLDSTLNPLLYAAIPRFTRSVGFLKGYLEYVSRRPHANGTSDDSSDESSGSVDEDATVKSLVDNLSSPSHEIRLVSLQILQKSKPSMSLVDLMLEIEETPLSLQHTRTVAMHLRKLAQEYNLLEDKGVLTDAVPAFMFGMLTVKLAPIWDDAVESLKQVSESKVGEQAVAALAFKWLDVPSTRWKADQTESTGSGPRFYSDFECTSMQSLQASADRIQEDTKQAGDVMLQEFDNAQLLVDTFPEPARSRSLKVLNAIPSIAEKRSRQLVPHFLCWAIDDDETEAASEDADAQNQGATWSLTDRKAILGVFSKFVNPRVLFEHEQVYKALLQLMENGDVEVQKLALKAILTWKQVGVKTYQENLEFLLDEARFKNELAVFLQDDELIKSEHRAELMPVLLRLLYGRTISKKGVASGRHGLQATRLAVIRNLSITDMGDFLEIATGKLRSVQVLTQTHAQRKALFKEPLVTVRKQVGFLNMTSSLIAELGTNVSRYMEKILNPVLYCLVFACMHLNEPETAAEDDGDEVPEKASNTSLLRVVRSTGIKCLIALFQNAQEFQWEPYHDIIVEEVVAPRTENLAVENTQGISGIMQLFSTWSVLPKAALFLAPHSDALPGGVLPKIIDCISSEKSKDDVRVCALDILRNLVRLALAPASESEFNELIKAELLDANVDYFLTTVTTVLQEQHTSPILLEACLETILSFAPIVTELKNIQAVVHIASYLLNQPPRRVSPKAKGRVLLIVEGFISSSDISLDDALLQQVYETLSSLFSYFKDRENRQSLSRALVALSKQDAEIAAIASLCNELNAFKEGRIDEPDYDRRLASFTTISSPRDVPWTPKQWLPLLHNTIFFIRVDEEFGILASNSADGIRRFIQNAADASDETKEVFESQLKSILMPAIYACARDPSETVRREILRVFGFLLSTMPTWSHVADVTGLLQSQTDDSTEQSFFFNLLSPALARQLEALRALEAANKLKQMDSQNISHFFIPMLEHFIFGRVDRTDDQGLGAEATNTIGSLAMSLSWNHYRTTLHRYIGYIGSKDELQKQTVRLTAKFADALPLTSEDQPEEMEIDEGEKPTFSKQRLATTVPKQDQLTNEILNGFLPPLKKYLHEKDESEVSYRVPVGVIIVKLLKMLPEGQMEQKLAGVLTDITHILRSKSLESRDLTRDTLVKIAVTLGSRYFGFILRELRSSLTKGYQLHVLSFTMHSILVATVPTFGAGDLDHCLNDIVMVIMDDIFGVVGQEKDAEGYTSQTKEIKSSKSQDSMELIARNASVTHLIHLIKPLRALLMQKVDLKIVRKIDALMARITAGLMQNPAAETRDTLVFCYEVIQDVYASEKPEAEEKMDPRIKKYLVQKGANRSGDRGKTTKHTHKLLRFAFDILRAMFKKHDSLRTPENIAGFIPMIGDVLVGGDEEVKISAFRLLAVIVKVPMPGEEGSKIFKVAVREATRGISTSTSTVTELSQAALKMLAVVLRDRRDVAVKYVAIDMLLGKLKDDFTEPLYRHVTFNFLRAVIERRIETATVYDTLDHVGTVMITNDDKDTRDLARGAFFQFIREYPQKKARWEKQLNFVVANLKYDREGGRLSVMEMLHLLLTKASADFTQEIASTCFLPLFFVLANDDSEKCCLAAGELLKEIFRKSDKERTSRFLTLLRSWAEKDESSPVLKFGIQVFGYYFEANEGACKNNKDFRLVLAKISDILSTEDIFDVDGELAVACLSVIQIFTSSFPESILSPDNESLWNNVVRCIAHPDLQTRLAAVRLVGLYLADFAKTSGRAKPGEAMEGSHGLVLNAQNLQNYVRIAFNALSGRNVDEALAAEATQLLIFLGPRLPDAPEGSDELLTADEDGVATNGADIDEAEDSPEQKDLSYVFRRLSHILRKEIPPRSDAITGKVSAMEILETISRRIPVERLRTCLKTVLEPLHNLTDPSIPVPYSSDELFKTRYEGIKTRAQIMMDSLQKKFGTAEYSKLLLEIREQVKAKRLARTSKRKIEAIAHPEKYGRDKRKRLEKDKERRKMRSKEQKTNRQSYKRW